MDSECKCDHPGDTFRGTLRHSTEGTGLSLFCDACSGWIEDSWLSSEGIPVQVTVESSRDYMGEWLTTFDLAPAST